MKDERFERFQTRMEQFRVCSAQLCAHSEAVFDALRNERIVPAEAAEQLSAALDRYRGELQALRDAGREFAIDVEGELASVSRAIEEYEARRNMLAERQLVQDYFRLCSMAENVADQLEESKRMLVELCRGEGAGERLRPFCLVVEHVKSGDAGLPDEAFDTIEAGIGKQIARATDRGVLRLEEPDKPCPYLDGSCELLTPPEGAAREQEAILPKIEPTPEAHESEPQAEELPEKEAAAPPQTLSEVPPLPERFDGDADGERIDIPDLPSICFNGKEFTEPGILPESFLLADGKDSQLFSLRVRLLKQSIRRWGLREQGLNLICVEPNAELPIACWAEPDLSRNAALSVRYVIPGIFVAEDELDGLRALLSAVSAEVTVAVLSEADGKKLQEALALPDTEQRLRIAVLPADSFGADSAADSDVISAVKEPGTLKETQVFVKARNKLREVKPGASTFLSELDKTRSRYFSRELLTLFSYFGAVSEETAAPLSELVFGFSEKREAIMKELLEQLAGKSILAVYELPGKAVEKHTVYCLTQYGYSSLHKSTVIQDIKRCCNQRIGGCKFIGSAEMELDRLAWMLNRELVMYCFLAEAQAMLDAPVLAKAVSSITSSENGELTISLPCSSGNRRLSVAFSYEEQPDSDRIILDVTNEAKRPSWVPDRPVDTLLLALQSAVFEWDGGAWTCLYQIQNEDEEAEDKEAASDPDAPPDAEAHTDRAETAELPPPPPPEAAGTERVADEAFPGPRETEEPLTKLLPELLAADAPSDQQLVSAINGLLREQTVDGLERGNCRALANALMLAKAASFVRNHPDAAELYQKLLAATGIPLDETEYTGERLSALFAADSRDDEAMKLAAYSFAMFAPQETYDFTLNGVCDQFVKDYDRLFPSFPRYKGLFIKLNEIRALVPEGFSKRVLGLLGDQAARQARVNAVSRKAAELCEAPNTNTGNLPGHQETLTDCFGPESEIGLCMRIIAENRTSDRGFVEEVYQLFCKENGKIVQSKIDSIVDDAWRKHRKHKGSLVSKGKVQVDNAYRARLELIKEWLDLDYDSSRIDVKAIRARSAELVAALGKELSALKKAKQSAQPAILYWTLRTLRDRLEMREPPSMLELFSGILFTGVISMTDDGLPVLEPEMEGIKQYEPWRNVIRHILAPQADAEAVRSGIVFENASPFYDNYRQLRLLGRYLGSDGDAYTVDEEDLHRAVESANAAEREFRQELEFAYTYDRIGEPEKERLAALLAYRDAFYGREDFACWRNFLHALTMQLEEMAEARRASLKKRLERAKAELSADGACPLLAEAGRLLEETQNYAVAEEYLNRFDAGERELSAETNLLRNEERTFEIFVSPEVYNPIYAECSKKTARDKNFRTFALNYISARYPKEWTSRYKEDAKEFVVNWPIGRDGTSGDNIEILLRLLGLDAVRVDKVKNSGRVQHFKANVRSAPRNKPDYQHPISAFGTQVRTPVNVLVLYGKHEPAEIVNKVNQMNLGSNTIVFIDYPLALADRRAVAEYFYKSTSGQNTFLLIDQVLAVFLALKSTNERLPAFLKCTLPFTRYQPFVFDGGPTSDDMFCGRVSELQKILDPQGACVVYGGRQLGKTALLQRAESLRSKPDDLHYAVYTNIIELRDEKDVVAHLIDDINKKTALRLRPAERIRELAAQLGEQFRKGAARSLLLLIDEADDFLERISSDKYVQLQPLVNLKRDTQNNFKFVLAGLHNVYRTRNATDQNGVFGQLGMPLCIKPLSPTDALQLISRPLMYLGFQVDRYPHLETILTNTNYYPGILQFFGYNLVQSVPSQYGEYFSAKNGNPPFTLEEKQLSAIMTSNDLNNSIKEKFRLSLKLDTRYFMLARVIALLYFEHDVPETSRDGFTVIQILDNARDLGIHCLEQVDYASAGNLLDEMVEMGILNRIEQTKGYCLRRRSFLNIIGADADSLLDEIVMENKETD